MKPAGYEYSPYDDRTQTLRQIDKYSASFTRVPASPLIPRPLTLSERTGTALPVIEQTVLRRVRAEEAAWFEQLATKKYDFTSTYWSATLDPEHCVYPLGYSSSPWNFSGIKDDKLDVALDKFRYTVDPTERKKAYSDVVSQMTQLAPMVFQVNFNRTYWTQPNIMGVATLPSLELRMEDVSSA